jgi:hypothetical protein
MDDMRTFMNMVSGALNSDLGPKPSDNLKEAEKKATCGCTSSCDHCGDNHTVDQIGQICECCGNKIKAVNEADYDLSTLGGKYGNQPVKGREGILQTDVVDDVNDIAATMEEDPELENFAMAFEKAVYASGDTSPEGIRAALEEVLPDYIAGSKIEDLMKVIEGVKEAVGDFAEPIYELIDELGDSSIVLDNLIRYLDGDTIKDFVSDFRREHDMNNTEESKDPTSDEEWSKLLKIPNRKSWEKMVKSSKEIDANSINESAYLDKVKKLLG